MTASLETVEAFVERWSPTGGGERSNYQMFLTELCELIEAPGPEPAVEAEQANAYVFERRVRVRNVDGPDSTNFIDLYKRNCFVLEAKQSAKRQKQIVELQQLGLDLPEQRLGSGKRGGAQWDTLMRNARQQAETYAKRLPAEEGWPPFLIVVDVGHVIELYADFSLQGKHYAQFPDRQSFRIYLEDLRDEKVRERLLNIWTNPESLNPARRTAEVTREIAELLAKLSTSLENRLIRALPGDLSPQDASQHRHAIAEKVALFLMRCLFTMFAEDVGLLKRESFVSLLEEYRGSANKLHLALIDLWKRMNEGGFSPVLRDDVLRFNGALFKDASAIEITEDDLHLLIIAAQRAWQDVEPAIFGTLLEHALDPRERHRLGAHYTPRAYVERLVVATIIEPLTDDWRNVQAAIARRLEAGKKKAAIKEAQAFHEKLCNTRVLDPACGTGNFLYVSLELMKRLEGEVLETLTELGHDQYLLELDRHTVDPHQFLGLEINPRAVAIAELVLWIGYLQWHFRTRGRTMPAEPVLKNFQNIREQDAVLAYDSWDLQRDETGKPVTRWDRVTYKLHPVTGEQVPDEDARVELRTYKNPKAATWPEAEFIVGNPPFIGGKDMRQELGDGYAEAAWKARPHIPGGADFVMHFWDKAAETVRARKARRFGLITTNSITQKFSRRVLERHLGAKKPLSLVFAIPDHPWMKSADKAAVRIAMTVGVPGARKGVLRQVTRETGLNTDAPTVELNQRLDKIQSNLTLGANVSSALPLRATDRLGVRGICLVGTGFMIDKKKAISLGFKTRPNLDYHIRPYINGRDITSRSRDTLVIDLFGLKEREVQESYPEVYQWLMDSVKPQRDQNKREAYRTLWWIFAEPRSELRQALKGLCRYIVTPMTAKHRMFVFLDTTILPDQGLVPIALEDAFFLGVLSSQIHVTWALSAGGRLGVGNDPRYNKTRCFDPFPFPDPPDDLEARIRDLGERLDAHRKAVLEAHKQLTMTGLYNVLGKVKAGEALSEAEKDVYDAGLVGVLRQIHTDLDAAVAEAYSWPADLPDEEILERLVALNHERAAEERDGKVRWLRPDFQAPKKPVAEKKPEQIEADLAAAAAKVKKPKLPAALPEQVAAIRTVLEETEAPITALDLSRRFSQGKKVEPKVEDVLRTLAVLGQAERAAGGYVLTS
ncbi:DNA methyltransferase [Pelagibius sp.]|uniref:class I SAM-dependent DNA methyltransferase n=1 Tax=Pelagibius sp. TaxID=1931238 RepID=UPI002630AF6C|nr:DNA methyltransferase [Pelagibius sp.]